MVELEELGLPGLPGLPPSGAGPASICGRTRDVEEIRDAVLVVVVTPFHQIERSVTVRVGIVPVLLSVIVDVIAESGEVGVGDLVLRLDQVTVVVLVAEIRSSVAVRIERLSVHADELVPVRDAVVVAIEVERVDRAVAVGVDLGRSAAADRRDLGLVVDPVAVGIPLLGVGPEQGLHAVEQPVAVRIDVDARPRSHVARGTGMGSRQRAVGVRLALTAGAGRPRVSPHEAVRVHLAWAGMRSTGADEAAPCVHGPIAAVGR